MMNIILALVLASLLILLVIYYKKFHNSKFKQVTVNDPKSQELYETNNNTSKPESLKIDLEEKIELSWKFLTNLHNKIMQTFSKEDKKVLYDVGLVFRGNGMKYHHDVDLSAKYELTKVQTTKLQKESSATRSR